MSSGAHVHPLDLTQASWLSISSHTGPILSSTWWERWLQQPQPTTTGLAISKAERDILFLAHPTEGSDWPCSSLVLAPMDVPAMGLGVL